MILKGLYDTATDRLLLKLSTLLNIEVATLKEWRNSTNEKDISPI